MLSLNCPSCGAAVNFQSKASVFAVCSFCKSTLVRQDIDLKAIGKMSELQDDLTPFQVGTTGMFFQEKFELVGRLKIPYQDGFWNEWYALFGDGKEAWLAEAQGFLGLCFPVADWQPPDLSELFNGRLLGVWHRRPISSRGHAPGVLHLFRRRAARKCSRGAAFYQR